MIIRSTQGLGPRSNFSLSARGGSVNYTECAVRFHGKITSLFGDYDLHGKHCNNNRERFFKLVVVTSYSSSSSSSSPLSLVDGNWSAWETWSTCSKTCDNGTRTRVRSCNNPAPAHEGKDCAGEGKKSEVCLVRHCPGKPHFLTGWRRMAFQTIFTLI